MSRAVASGLENSDSISCYVVGKVLKLRLLDS